jgi:oxygen-independent coproporphyrinogen-3 oxidase
MVGCTCGFSHFAAARLLISPEPRTIHLPMGTAANIPRSAYIHVPFCRHRCGYCNFTLVAGRDDLTAKFLQAIEVELSGLKSPREVDTLFFGGGTPSHLSVAELEQLLLLTRRWFPLAIGGEFSVEANPSDLHEEKVALLAEYGVNRISLGGQSFDPKKLAILERDHSADDISRTVQSGRRYLRSVSLDLIFGTPGETIAGWQSDLSAALQLRPQHLSTYGLTFERGTSYWNRLAAGELQQLDEETERSMYALAIDTITAAGYQHYEVSNFALPGHHCRHNEAYWRGESYYAAGPGAARYVDGRREMNHRSTTTYLKRVLRGQSPVTESETLPPEDRARELLVFGLRRIAGVERDQFAARSGFRIDDLVGPQLADLVTHGLMVDDGRRLALTREGLYVSDAIWPRFLRR